MPSPRPARKAPPTREGARASFARLRAYIGARATLTPEEFDTILASFAPRHLAKGEFLQRGGEPARYMVFVARGCLRSYAIDETGKVHIVRFAPEDWWLADSVSFGSGGPATVFIDAIEASDVLIVDGPSHRRLVDGIPSYAAAYLGGLQRLAAAKDERLISSLSASAPDRYLAFAAKHPALLGRIPLRMLASYLGMSPETLSRIRRNLSTRKGRPDPRHKSTS